MLRPHVRHTHIIFSVSVCLEVLLSYRQPPGHPSYRRLSPAGKKLVIGRHSLFAAFINNAWRSGDCRPSLCPFLVPPAAANNNVIVLLLQSFKLFLHFRKNYSSFGLICKPCRVWILNPVIHSPITFLSSADTTAVVIKAQKQNMAIFNN